MKKSMVVGIVFAVLMMCQLRVNGANNAEFEEIQSVKEYEEVMSEGLQESGSSIEDGVSADVNTDYALKRILILTDIPPKNTYGASKVYHFAGDNIYILEYTTEEETEAAYDRLKLIFRKENVLLDRKISIEGREEPAVENNKKKDAASPDLWGISLMGLDTLRAQAEGKWNEKITVAVIDTGIDTDHPWFQGRISEDSVSLVAGEDYEDKTGHGTHVSGIIAQGTTDNVEIMAVRLFNEDGDTTISLLLEAINYIIEKKPDVVNMSMGQSTPPAWETAVLESKFKEYINSGGVICTSAGNKATFVSRAYPASSSNTIAVSSITRSITEPVSYSFSNSFSNYGGLIDFTAPGEWIESAWIGGGTKSIRGTSMSCPHVSAAAAMVKVRYPGYSQEEVYKTLQEYAVDMGAEGKDDYYGYGYINLADFYQNNPLEDTSPIDDPSEDPPAEDEPSGENPPAKDDPSGDSPVKDEPSGETPPVKDEPSGETPPVKDGSSGENPPAKDDISEKKPVIEPVDMAKVQTISVAKASYEKEYGSVGFSLGAKAEGVLSYYSSNSAVAMVDGTGRVMVKGVGKADIIIRAAATPSCQPAEKTVRITVSPQKVSLKKVSGAKKKIKVSWKKLSYVTGYQIRYSLKRNMSSAKKVKVSGAGKASRIIGSLKPNKTYYVQIRGYKKLSGKTYYGNWSSLKRIKTK